MKCLELLEDHIRGPLGARRLVRLRIAPLTIARNSVQEKQNSIIKRGRNRTMRKNKKKEENKEEGRTQRTSEPS